MYQSLFDLIHTYVYSGATLTSDMSLVCTLISTIGCLSPSYYAAFGVAPDCLSYDSRLSFSAPIYVFKRNRFGRFVSVDLSDRSFLDLLSKFSH